MFGTATCIMLQTIQLKDRCTEGKIDNYRLTSIEECPHDTLQASLVCQLLRRVQSREMAASRPRTSNSTQSAFANFDRRWMAWTNDTRTLMRRFSSIGKKLDQECSGEREN